MKILNIQSLSIPDVKIIRYQRFTDNRGYFTETFRQSDFENFLPKDFKVIQINESYSKKFVFRGLHLQYQPKMAKIVRVIEGEVIDFFLDLRKNSSTFGKIGACQLTHENKNGEGEWIFIPHYFAHGVLFLKEGRIEYLCDASWNPQGELSVNLFDKEINWNLCSDEIKKMVFPNKKKLIISEKDQKGLSVNQAVEKIY